MAQPWVCQGGCPVCTWNQASPDHLLIAESLVSGGGGLEKGARGPERSPHFILCHGESGLIQLEFEWMRLPNVGWWCQPPISEHTLFMSPVSICDSVMALSFPVQKQLPGGAGSVLLGRGLGYRSCSFWKSIKVFRVISAAL